MEAAIYKLHTRRCCTLEFHPGRDSIVVSGDKKGGIAVWDFDKVSGSQAEAAGGSTAADGPSPNSSRSCSPLIS